VRRMKRRVTVPVAAVLAIAALATVLVSSAAGRSDAQVAKGGTYRVGWESSFGWTDSFDPTGEYLANAFAINTNLLLRGLIGYNHVGGPAGATIVPDLATKVPKPTNGGRRYTFTIKNGVRFGPPVNRQIVAKDVKYAVERMARPKNGAQYSFYFTVIKGYNAYAAGKAKSISGIKTPNARTVIFDLTSPTGDFLMRLGMPAVYPMPPEVAKCFEGKPGAYGRYVIASGPYMIEGSDDLDISSCGAMKPISGYDGQTRLNLVRNPNYNARTDSRKARESNPDRFEFIVNSNIDDIYNKIGRGDYDDSYATASPKVFREYSVNASKRKYLHSNSADGTYYITMNLTQAPFDDVHVRKAMNWVLDREAMRRAWGGPVSGVVAEHIIPNSMLANKLAGFHPFKTVGDRGNVAKARAEMAKSKYANSGGVCSAKECKNVLLVTDVRAVDKLTLPIVQAGASKLGISFTVRSVNGAYPVIQTTSRNVPISNRARWFKDFADASTFIGPLFDGRNIIPSGNTNYALVGMKPSQVKSLGVKGTTKGIPSIDKLNDRCSKLPLGSARTNCFAGIDRVLTKDIVPWIPYMWANTVTIISPNVTQWKFDQNAGFTALAHVAVKS
jgi:peptide/nickel transport system substrate-binding protein